MQTGLTWELAEARDQLVEGRVAEGLGNGSPGPSHSSGAIFTTAFNPAHTRSEPSAPWQAERAIGFEDGDDGCLPRPLPSCMLGYFSELLMPDFGHQSHRAYFVKMVCMCGCAA